MEGTDQLELRDRKHRTRWIVGFGRDLKAVQAAMEALEAEVGALEL